jgi:non-specific serine/threonine protein kinase
MERIGDALELPRSPEVEPLGQVVSHLQGRPWLLVLDNFEHLLEGGATQLRTLLERVETLSCLVTSRQVLGLSGEQELALLPLPTPRRSEALERLQEYASVQLFVDRARAARAEFALAEANAAVVAELCDRLEGLPLALELAATRVAVLSPQQMLAQLEQRFEFLVSRRRDLSPRHRTLRAAIESSYQLLEPPLQRFFARLSVFRGGWTLEAAQAVCHSGGGTGPDPLCAAASGGLTALEELEQLRECSLIGVEERGGEVRYRLLETLREYAWEQLSAAGELAAVRTRHRDWYLQLAEQADATATKPEQKEWLTRLEGELENLRAALAWCQEEADANPAGDGAEVGLRLAVALWSMCIRRGYLRECLQWLEGMLTRGDELPAGLRAEAFIRAAHMAHGRGDLSRSLTLLQSARREYEKVLTLARREGSRADVVRTLVPLIEIAVHDDLDAAWNYGVEARQCLEEMDEPHALTRTLEGMARVALRRGDPRTARGLLEQRLAICRKLGASEQLVHALGAMGHLERDEGNYGQARAYYQESLLMRRELGSLLALAQSLEDMAVLAGRLGEAERAIRLLGAEEEFCETLGARPPVAIAAEYERTVTEGRAALGEAAFAARWAEGRTLTLEQAIDYALGGAAGAS